MEEGNDEEMEKRRDGRIIKVGKRKKKKKKTKTTAWWDIISEVIEENTEVMYGDLD